MNIQKDSVEKIFEYIDLQENDTILYLGGRIDDDNLYPAGYRKYLNSKIKELSPDKIICHNYWYAKKYYEKGILSEDTKIDMVLSFYDYFQEGEAQLNTINPEDYNGHRDWIKILIGKNPNIVYVLYIDDNATLGNRPPSVYVNDDWFGEDYDLNNVKYFDRDRRYSLSYVGDKGYALLDHVSTLGADINSTGGFAMIKDMLAAGFKNINILGFTAFGANEDQSHFTPHGPYGSYAGRKYFDLKTSENQRVEADILKYWAQNNKIKNIENYEKLMSCPRDVNDSQRKTSGDKMQPAIKDLFDKIQNAKVQTEPFDHIIIDNLLPKDLYEELAKELEAEDFPSNYKNGSYGGEERFAVDITNYDAWEASHCKIPTTIHQDNYTSLLSKKIPDLCNNFNISYLMYFWIVLLKNRQGLYSVLSSKLPTERIQNNYFFHASMVKDRVGYKVNAHTDSEKNIFTILFYAPETDINKMFGLNAYEEGGTTSVATYNEPRNLELVKQIDFIPNRMIAFAPSKDCTCAICRARPSTWHSVRQLSDKLVGTRNSFQIFFLRNKS